MPQISDEVRAQAEQLLGYHFHDPKLLAEALTHASVAEHRLASNERMEFLGDAILGGVVCEYLFHNYPHYLEGELTKIKSAVVSRRVCANVSMDLGLPELLNLGKGMSGRDGLPLSLAAAVYESLVAAIYLDGGHEPVQQFILKHMQPVIEEAAGSAHQENFKSLLQQHAQRHLSELPSYRVLGEKGPDHSKHFEVAAEIAGRRFPPAWGASKKQAEQQAALLALQELGLVQIDSAGQVHMSQGIDRSV
jgi:ribonuclease III